MADAASDVVPVRGRHAAQHDLRVHRRRADAVAPAGGGLPHHARQRVQCCPRVRRRRRPGRGPHRGGLRAGRARGGGAGGLPGGAQALRRARVPLHVSTHCDSR